MANHRSQFGGDTTFTKVFVGGLAWETPTEEMRRYFEQFGHILEAVIINDKHTGKSKGYGFVTFRDPDSARKACADPKPMIYGRRANCNIASLGRPPSPRGTNNISVRDGGKGVRVREKPATYYNGVPAAAAPPSLMYSAASRYPTYTTDYGYHQAQYYQPFYGQSYSYYYGYYVQTPRPRAPFFTPHQADRFPSVGASYPYYPAPMEGYCPPMPYLSPTDSGTRQRSSSERTDGVGITSESANSQGKN